MPDTSPLRYVLHVGMGKTGTSAIQSVLAQSSAELQQQGARHLGFNFDMPGLTFRHWDDHQAFFDSPPEERRRLGQAYADYIDGLARAEGLSSLILSNEAFSGRAEALAPFLEPLQKVANLRVLIWARNPVSWLPSAYAQWGVSHKTQPGRVEPFSIGGRRQIGQYRGILEWGAAMPGVVELRPYLENSDIVADFAAAAGITLPPAPQRVYARPEPAELVLRALYNSRFSEPVLPDRYERALRPGKGRFGGLDRFVPALLDYTAAAEIVDEHADLFDDIAAATGIELRDIPGTVTQTPAVQNVRRRLFDHLTAITLDQAARIEALEQRLAKLEGRLPRTGD